MLVRSSSGGAPVSRESVFRWIHHRHAVGCSLDTLRLLADALDREGEHQLATFLRIHSWNEDHQSGPYECGNLVYVGLELLGRWWPDGRPD